MNLVELLKQQEGYRRHPYDCTEGFLTVAYGRNLDTNGISEREAEYLLKNDIDNARSDLTNNLSFFWELSPTRKDALINMVFQLGLSGVIKFKMMLHHLKEKDFQSAAREALDSKWAKQTPSRAEQIAKMIEHDTY